MTRASTYVSTSRGVLRQVLAALCGAAALLPLAAVAAPAEMLQLQGRLTSAAGTAVPDGDYALTLRFYAAKADAEGDALEVSIDPAVAVAKGAFTLNIGSKLKLNPAPFREGKVNWVGIQVGSDPELPRLQLNQVPYAMRAAIAGDLECSGCVGVADLAPAVLAPYAKTDDLKPYAKSEDLQAYAKSADLKKVATSGSYGDLSGKPTLPELKTCPSGQVLVGHQADGTIQCATDKDTIVKYDGADFALTNQACASGSIVAGFDAAGKVVCVADKDTDTNYDGGDFALSGQACPPGQHVAAITANGKITCVADKDTDTKYDGGDFAVSNQACPSGQYVSGVTANGKVTCAADKDTDTTYSGANFATSGQACASGQVVTGLDANGKVTCAADKDTDTTYSGANFATSGQACASGQVVTGLDANGKVTCAADKDTTYSGANFATSGQACPSGQVVTGLDANGKVTCAADKDTTYSGTNFATSGQNCSIGQVVTGLDASGKVVCAADKDTNNTYNGTHFAVSNQGCPPNQVVVGLDSSGKVSCAADKDTNTTYSGANFATSGQACPAGQVVTGVNASGAVTCATDKDTDTNTTYSGANFAVSNQGCSAGQIVTGINSSGGVTCAAEKSGIVFTRWGRGSCPTGSTLVYAGYQAGHSHDQGGSGANQLCLSNDPKWLNFSDGNHNGALVYGTEYEMGGYGLAGVSPFNGLHDYSAPCAVCLDTRFTTQLMIPGTYTCPSGWTNMYYGYLMSEHFTHASTEYVCVDYQAEKIGSVANHNGNLLYPTEIECGSLQCASTGYVQDRELTCTVCAR